VPALEKREILTLNKIVVQRRLPLVDQLSKDLFHKDSQIAISALKTLDKLQAEGLRVQYQNLFKNSSDEIRIKILENMRNSPSSEYAPFLQSTYRDSISDAVREKTLLAMGGVAQEDSETKEFLRSRTGFDEKSHLIRRQATAALVVAQDFDYLKTKWQSFIEVEEDEAFIKQILASFKGFVDRDLFLALYKFQKGLPEPLGDRSLWAILALFDTYKPDQATQSSFSNIQEKLIQGCRSEEAEEVGFSVKILTRIDLDKFQSFASKAFVALIMGKSHTEKIRRTKRDLLTRKISTVFKNEASQKSIRSVLEKLLVRYREIMEETRKTRMIPVGQNPRKEFAEFFETLGNANLLAAVISYLKSNPPEDSKRNLIVSIIKKLKLSFSDRQKALLSSVIKLLMTDDGRTRSQLGIECGRINLEESLEEIFDGAGFLAEFAPSILGQRLFKVLAPLYETLAFFPAGRESAHVVLQAIASSGQKECLQFTLDHMHVLLEREQENLFEALPLVARTEFDFLRDKYSTQAAIAPVLLSTTLSLLEASPPPVSEDWIRILYQLEEGRFGAVSEESIKRMQLLLARGGLTSYTEALSDRLRGGNYRLGDHDLELMLSTADGINSIESEASKTLKDLAYGCLKDENSTYLPGLGYVLARLQDSQGVKMLRDALLSGDDDLCCQAIHYCRRGELKDCWQEVLQGVLKSESFRIHQQIVGYFSQEKLFDEERDRALLTAEITFLRTGERPEVPLSDEEELSGLADQEKQNLEVLFDQMRSARMDNKTRFEMEKNMKDVTIFFIDIAGFTKRSNTSDISEIMLMLDDFGKIIQPIGEKFNGTLIKKIGDCFMYTFDAPIDAVLASIEIQRQLKVFNEMTVESERVHTRIGLNTGKVFLKENDVYGDPVNTAARVESKAPTDGLLVNETTFDGVREFVLYEKMDLIQVKGIDEPLQTYHILGTKPGVMGMYSNQEPIEEPEDPPSPSSSSLPS
jgi:class 3 adenylate cyclase